LPSQNPVGYTPMPEGVDLNKSTPDRRPGPARTGLDMPREVVTHRFSLWRHEDLQPPASSSRILAREDSPPYGKPKLLDRLRQKLRARHHSRRTEQAYVLWVKRFIFFHSVKAVLAHLRGDKWSMGLADVRRRAASYGVPAVAGSRHRLFSQRGPRPRRL